MKKVIVGAGIFVRIVGIIIIIVPYVYVPKTVSEAYPVTKSTVVLPDFWGSLIVTPAQIGGKGTYLNTNDSLNIWVNATSKKGIDFYVNAVNQSNGDILATYLFYPDVTTVNKDWVVPLSSEYNFEFCSNYLFTRDDVSLLVTKYWTETAYRDVFKSYPVLPFDALYVGIVIVIIGIATSIYGLATRKPVPIENL
jgi:hypothetical protein